MFTHLSDYTEGRNKLPVQWTAWLSFTRPDPPSLAELQHDAERVMRLSGRIQEIEQREMEERIRQGYITGNETEEIHSASNFGKLGAGGSRIKAPPSFASEVRKQQQPTIPWPENEKVGPAPFCLLYTSPSPRD